MKLDEIIIQRFKYLIEKAKQVEDTRYIQYEITHVQSEIFQEWAVSALSLVKRVFGADSVHFNSFEEKYKSMSNYYIREFQECRGILRAAKEDYEGGYLFTVRGLVSAEFADDILEQAEELNHKSYKDPAAVLAGVALESAIKEICTRNGIQHGKLEKMNADLAKAGIYNVGMQKQITAWADRRNNAAHGNWNEYSLADVEEMIAGVRRFIAERL